MRCLHVDVLACVCMCHTAGLISSGVLLASNLLPPVDNETSLTHTDTLTEDDNNDNTQTVTDAQGAVLVVSRRERRRAERALRGTGRVMRRGVQRLGGGCVVVMGTCVRVCICVRVCVSVNLYGSVLRGLHYVFAFICSWVRSNRVRMKMMCCHHIIES